eukprot:1313765-Pleurochrysis_carterae.AAC.1
MACADDALVLSKLTAMHGVIKVQAEEGRGGARRLRSRFSSDGTVNRGFDVLLREGAQCRQK